MTTCRLSLWQWWQSQHHENWRLKWPRVELAEVQNQGTVSIWRSSLWKAAEIPIICGLTSIGFSIIKIRPITTDYLLFTILKLSSTDWRHHHFVMLVCKDQMADLKDVYIPLYNHLPAINHNFITVYKHDKSNTIHHNLYGFQEVHKMTYNVIKYPSTLSSCQPAEVTHHLHLRQGIIIQSLDNTISYKIQQWHMGIRWIKLTSDFENKLSV